MLGKLGGIVSSLGDATGGVVLVFAVAFGVGTVIAQAQLLLLGLIFMAIAVVSDTAWALAAGFARDWSAGSPRRITNLSAVGGFALIGLGIGSLFIPNAKQSRRPRR